ncbi:L,D-transpeptidase family protein [Phenylobacterium sp.]|uniref:L,D-transpeptidase family protein n=1 Tax=Phenylobacterium sp. TaxID=1871053 RepID=UPI002E2FB5B6|nr:L,D-transpeptidase family protein [Phenylobacterium sp.]HEX2560130.1 L,D-transpeptidase family protein [Phenylobacterium sp.]
MRAELQRMGASELAAFYEARDFRPLWVKGRSLRPEAQAVIALVGAAAADGLDPSRHDPGVLARATVGAPGRDPAQLARAEIALSTALAAYVRDLRSPPDAARMVFTDPALKPPATDPSQVLAEAAAAPDLAAHLASTRRMNPLYAQLRAALADLRSGRMAVPDGDRQRYESLLLANMARARQIPADPGRRFIVVDAASAQLFLYEDGRVVDQMDVVVGKPRYATPMMAGVIRYAVFNPYWNVPVDLVRDDFARRVLRQGVSILEAQRLEVLSDWSEQARPVDPARVDWSAVAAGRKLLRVRQRPGGDNMMGQVKLMLPNELGIYLHDTPHRWAFDARQRTFSSGCVRLERAMPLAKRLLGAGAPAMTPAEPEHRVDLAEPVPVFITYFTAWPASGGLEVRRDAYGRDPPLIAALEAAEVRRLASAHPHAKLCLLTGTKLSRNLF